jgi:hypothetical protein
MEADMKVFRLGHFCLLALVVLGLAVCASASATEYAPRALPEAGHCVKVAMGTGEYRGKLCIVRELVGGTRGSYNWVPASATEKLEFEGGGIEVVLATQGHSPISCAVANVTGTYTGPKTATATIELQGCKNGQEELCFSPSASNQIKSLPLEAELGFIKNELKEGHKIVKVGMDFRPQSPSPALFTYQCGAQGPTESQTIEGSVIAADKPIDKPTLEDNLTFHVTLHGTQDPEKFESGVKDTLITKFTTGLESTTAASTLSIKSYVGKNTTPVEILAKEKAAA